MKFGAGETDRTGVGEFAARFEGVPVLVVGASGFIGRWLARTLAAGGARLTLGVRDFASVREEKWGEPVEVDLRDHVQVASLVERAAPVVTFNAAGYGVDRTERDEVDTWRLNAECLIPLVEAIARVEAPRWPAQRLVHCGSSLEYGRHPGDLDEETPVTPDTVYGRSKLEGTRAVWRASRRLGLASLTARLFNVYGPGEHAGRLIPILWDAARSGEAVELTEGRQQHDFTYVEDVVEGLLRLAVCDAPPGETVNLASGALTSVRSFCEQAARAFGVAPEQLRFGAKPARDGQMEHGPVSNVRLRRYTGWSPETSIEAGLERTLGFLRGAPDAGSREGAAS